MNPDVKDTSSEGAGPHPAALRRAAETAAPGPHPAALRRAAETAAPGGGPAPHPAALRRPAEAAAPAYAHGDPIRVVPLHLPDEMKVAPAVPPHLTFRNGPLLKNVEVFTVFWGAAWQQVPQSDLANNVNQFFDFILTSALIDQLAEYSVPGQAIGYGQRTGTITLTAPPLHHSVSDNAIQHMLQQEIATHAKFPQPTPNTLYFVYLPPGVTVVQGGGSSCQVFCGYHNDINGQIFYAVMPYPGCVGCLGDLAALNALTSTSSHELCEAITDAIPGQGWYDDTNGEIGDICAWQTKQVGQFTVQLEWSNQKDQCM